MGVMPYNIRQCRGKDRDGYLPSPFSDEGESLLTKHNLHNQRYYSSFL